jgi:hypothetical protein
VRDGPEHPLRLQNDAAMGERVEDIKASFASSARVRAFAGQLWGTVKATLTDALGDSASELRVGATSALVEVASVTRQGGADRFAASVTINKAAFPTALRTFLATGFKFPDALAGSAWAGAIVALLYVANSTCVRPAALAAMRDQGVRTVTLLGGPATLTQSVESLTPCVKRATRGVARCSPRA